MRVIITLLVTLFLSLNAMADISVIKGKIVDSKTGKGVAGVSVKLSTGVNATTNSEGVFELNNVLPGKGVLIITAPQMLEFYSMNLDYALLHNKKNLIDYLIKKLEVMEDLNICDYMKFFSDVTMKDGKFVKY